MVAAANNPFPSILTVEGTTPSTPAAGQQRLFVRSSDHVLCYVNSSGTVTAVSTGLTNPMTTKGDIIQADTGGTPTRLGAGTSGQVLTSGGAAAFSSWATPSAGTPPVSYLGYNTIGGTAFTLVNSTIYMKKITVAATGILLNVAAYIGLRSGQDGTNSPVWTGIWTDNAGVPLTLLGWGGGSVTTELLLDNLSTAGGLVDRWICQAMNVEVTAADYWIGFCGGNVATAYHGYNDGSGTDKTVVQTVPVQDIGWVVPTTTALKYSIRALFMATS